MNEIDLTKNERKIYKALVRNPEMEEGELLKLLPKELLIMTLKSLKGKEIIAVIINYGDIIDGPKLTIKGLAYIQCNPKLRTKFSDTNKWVISTIITVILALATIVIQLL